MLFAALSMALTYIFKHFFKSLCLARTSILKIIEIEHHPLTKKHELVKTLIKFLLYQMMKILLIENIYIKFDSHLYGWFITILTSTCAKALPKSMLTL